jgi:hypothetical protein
MCVDCPFKFRIELQEPQVNKAEVEASVKSDSAEQIKCPLLDGADCIIPLITFPITSRFGDLQTYIQSMRINRSLPLSKKGN